MTTYTMTEAETKAWESEDGKAMDAARREIRHRAQQLGSRVEIYSADGVLMDVVEAR